MFKSLVYAKNCEMWWLNFLSNITDYKPKTTFFSDLSIAEYFGINAILHVDTYADYIVVNSFLFATNTCFA